MSNPLQRLVASTREVARRSALIRRVYWSTFHLSNACADFLRLILISLKWRRDRKTLPLCGLHWPLYRQAHNAYLQALGRFPNLREPRDFNDKIQWLKIFDQDPLKIRCSDKLSVREFVTERAGSRYLTQLYQASDSFAGISFSTLPQSFALKTTHATGGVVLVPDKDALDREAARKKLEASLRHAFGWATGEWPYTFIQPRIFAEELLPCDGPVPPPDYKFHCAQGAPLGETIASRVP